MALDPAWVEEQLVWLKAAPRLSTKDRLALGRDRIRNQWEAEKERNAQQRNQAAQASPVMGPPSFTHGAQGARKRKEPDRVFAVNAYANVHPAQRPRVLVPTANPSASVVEPQGESPFNPNQAYSMPAFSPTNMGASLAWNPAHAVGQNRRSVYASPVAPLGNSHGMPSQHQRGPIPRPNQQQPHAPVPTSAPAFTDTRESQPHMVPLERTSTAHPSPVTIKQEVPTSNPAQRSSTEPSYAHNSRSTTVEGGSPAGPISGASTPPRDGSLDVNIIQSSETRSHHQSSDAHYSRALEEVHRPTPTPFVDDGPSAHVTLHSPASPNSNSAEASVLSPAVGNADAGESHSVVERAEPQSSSSSTNGSTTSPTAPHAGSSHATDTAPAVEKQTHDFNSTSHGSRQSAERARSVQSADVTNASKLSASLHLNASSRLDAPDSQVIRLPPANATAQGNRPLAAAAVPSLATSRGKARASPESPLMVSMDLRPADDTMSTIRSAIEKPNNADDDMDYEPVLPCQDDGYTEATGDTTSPEVDASQAQADSPKETTNDAGSAIRPNLSVQPAETASRASSSSLSSLVETPLEASDHGSPGIVGAKQHESRPSSSAANSKESVQRSSSESRWSSSSAASADSRKVQSLPVANPSSPNAGTAKDTDAATKRVGSPVNSRDSTSRRSSHVAKPTEAASRSTHESLPVMRPSDSVWSDRRRPSARQVSPAAESMRVASSETAIQSSSDIRHRVEKNWPNVSLKRYEAFNRNMMEKIAFFAARGITERVVRAHINMEALIRMERKTKDCGANISGDPYPTESDCTQVKERYWTWQKKKKNFGVAPKNFPLPDEDQAEQLMRKFALQVSRDGFLEYRNEQEQVVGAERGYATQTVRPELIEEASLAPGPRRGLKRPAWYANIKQQELQSRSRNAGYAGVDAKLGKIKKLMRDCAEKKTDAFDDIRRELHQLAFVEVNKIVVRKAQMIHEDTGLPQLFAAEYSKGVDYPWDIQADALELYNRWCLQIFSIDLLRGIVKSKKSHNRSTDRIEPGYAGKSGADHHGQGNLVNGQWWPTQLCTVRDGAHGSTQGGIYSVKGKAAFSIIVSGGSQYYDRDEGHELWYSGTNSTDGKYTENTHSLILSVEHKKPVRVIRSHNIHKGASEFRPARGFRYDGLYDVVGYEVADEAKKACLFHMVRRPNQAPIRAEGKAMRPTEEEIAEYDKIRKELNEVGSDA